MTGDPIPKARVRRRRLFRLIWIVPVMAIAVAAYLVFHRMQDYGPEVTIAFSDGGGLRVGQTPVRYRGVQVGEVVGVRLSKDEKRRWCVYASSAPRKASPAKAAASGSCGRASASGR